MVLKMVSKVGSIHSCQKIQKVISSVIRIWNKLKMLNFWRVAPRPWLFLESLVSLDLLQYDLKVQITRILNPDQVRYSKISQTLSQLGHKISKIISFNSTVLLLMPHSEIYSVHVHLKNETPYALFHMPKMILYRLFNILIKMSIEWQKRLEYLLVCQPCLVVYLDFTVLKIIIWLYSGNDSYNIRLNNIG